MEFAHLHRLTDGEKGEILFERENMNVPCFRKYCLKHLVPAIRSHLPSLPEVTKVVVQMDRAGGHGGGRGDISKTLRILNVVAKESPLPLYSLRSLQSHQTSMCSI